MTLQLGEAALQIIRTKRLSAAPKFYEVWYLYAAGRDLGLKAAIDATIASKGAITNGDIAGIAEIYCPSNRAAKMLDDFGTRILVEIDSALTAVSEARVTSAAFQGWLKRCVAALTAANDADQVQAAIRIVAAANDDAKRRIRAARERLAVSREEVLSIQQEIETLRLEIFTDPLTGCRNRKSFDRDLIAEIRAARASNQPLTLLMIDIDRFKEFNDRFGHVSGDLVLRLVGKTLTQCLKGRDVAARFGGEEFAILLPNTAIQQATIVAENIRRSLGSRELKKKSTGEPLGRVSISVGIAALSAQDDMNSIVERADGCLYDAKRTGRNRVVTEAELPPAKEKCARVAVH
ncbi:MAG: diguanylate cyclase [Xanthobacteraceae bacterium]